MIIVNRATDSATCPHVALEGVVKAAGNGGKHHVELSNDLDGGWHFEIYDDTNLRIGYAMAATPLAAAVAALYEAVVPLGPDDEATSGG